MRPQVRGTTYEGLMHVTDWTATLASVTGIPTVRRATNGVWECIGEALCTILWQ